MKKLLLTSMLVLAMIMMPASIIMANEQLLEENELLPDKIIDEDTLTAISVDDNGSNDTSTPPQNINSEECITEDPVEEAALEKPVQEPELVELQFQDLSQSPPLLSPGPSALSISINENIYTTFDEAIEQANTGDTLVVSGGPVEITKSIKIPANKKLTLDLGGQTLISALEVSANNLFYISGEGNFTLKNGILIGKDVDEDGYTGRALYAAGANITVESIEASGFSYFDRGGVVSIDDEGKAVQISLINNNFHDNKVSGSGGAIAISTKNQSTETKLDSNIIKANKASQTSNADGGGIVFSGKGVLKLTKNSILDNECTVTEKDSTYSIYWSRGGGITIDSNFNSSGNLHVIMEANTICNNKTQGQGGGVFFFLDASEGDNIELKSGTFSGNHSDYAGGAIDYSLHNQPTFVLKNFLMTGNKAAAGGAIWICPTVHMNSYSTLGGAALGNQLIDSVVDTEYKNSGRDIQFEGKDTQISSIKSGIDPSKHIVTVVDRTFTGEKINWYADDAGNLYKEGDSPIELINYTERDSTFGLYGKLESSDWVNRYKSQALLIFENNTAGVRGAAISSNSAIQIGEPGDVQLKVQKKWLDIDGKELTADLPNKVDVQLIRKDATGGFMALETVSLSASNNWQHTFERLPAKGLVNGQIVDFTYTVQETEITGYQTTLSISPDNSSLILTNKKSPEPTPTTIPTTSSTSPAETTGPSTPPEETEPRITIPWPTEPRPTEVASQSTQPAPSQVRELPRTGQEGLPLIPTYIALSLALLLFVWRKKTQ